MNLPAEKTPRPSEAAGGHDLDFDEDDANDILDSLPDDTPADVRAVIRRAFHSGPVPSAGELQRYENVLPGLADRLVTMAEREQSIRGSDTRHYNWNLTLKVVASVIVSLAMVLGGVYCAVIGEPTVGGIIATSGVIAGVVQSYLQKPPRDGGTDRE